jgi:uncharacterized protein YeeX (DUF496 family)
MPIVHLPDNSLEIINDNHDLVKLIKQHMGYEIAQSVEELCEVIRAEEDYEERLEDNQFAFDVLDDHIDFLLNEAERLEISESITNVMKKMKRVVESQM